MTPRWLQKRKALSIVKRWYTPNGSGEGVEFSHREGNVLWFDTDRGDVWVDTTNWDHNEI